MYFHIALFFITITYVEWIALVLKNIPFEYLGLIFVVNAVSLLVLLKAFNWILCKATKFDKPNKAQSAEDNEYMNELRIGCGLDAEKPQVEPSHLQIRERQESQERKKPVV